MHRSCLALAVSLCAAANAWAALAFEKNTIEVTPAPSATEVSVKYPFRNTGTKPVRIVSVSSDCACTVPTTARKEYAAGEAGELEVKFEIGNRQGDQRKVVILTTDDPAEPLQTLILSAKLPKVLTASTPGLLWAENEEHREKVVSVTTSESPAVRELRATSANTNVTLRVQRDSPTQYRVLVTPTAAAKNVSAAVELEAVTAEGPAKRSLFIVRVR